jgi:two-component system cell cycle sensor histidine kinase/response regulator CckA
VIALFARQHEAGEPRETAKRRHDALLDRLPLVTYASRFDDDTCLYVSPQIEPILGWRADEAVGKERVWVAHVLADDGHRLRTALQTWLAGPMEAPFRAAYRVLGAHGRIVTVAETMFLVRAETGEPVAFEGYLLDLSEHRKLEVDVQQAQKLEALGRLVGGVAHDFNNILAVIRGYGDRLSERLASQDGRADALAIVDAAERGTELVRQLRAFSRPSPLDLQVLELNAIVTDVVPMLQRLVGEDIELELDLEPGALPISADAGHIGQVVVNLVLNARDSMPTGGRLTVRSALVDLAGAGAHWRMDQRYAVLTVEDTGVGMDTPTKERMFEPFFSTKGDEGTGLGLATVYTIVREAGGSIAVSSAPGEGTVLSVNFPLATGEATPVPEHARTRARGGSETVLVVEDDPALRELERLILERAGYRVLTAGNGAEAIAFAEGRPSPIDLLLSDVVLPGLSGPELVEAFTALGRDIPVVFVSGYDEDSLSGRGIAEATGTTVITKPFDNDVLLAAVRTALDGRRPSL